MWTGLMSKLGFARRRPDLLILSVPFVFPTCPPIGPAILRAQLRKHGYSCDVWDLNIELYHIEKFRYVFESDYDGFAFDPSNNISHFKRFYDENLKGIVRSWAERVCSISPQVLGLSLFSNRSAYMAERLICEIKACGYSGPIVLGGPFADHIIKDSNIRSFFPAGVDIIAGEAELSILKYMKGELNYPGINSDPVQLDNLDLIPIPEYTRKQFKEYDRIDGSKRAYITTSRGCVRRCTFCDVKNLWPKYRYRSAKSVFDEMIYLHEKFGRTEIKFTDSLINGNLKSLTELCELLVKHRCGEKFRWGGQFICRSRSSMPPKLFQLLSDAGCRYVSIGVESGSERVRAHMRKGFSNEDLFYTLEQLNEVGIAVNLLMMIGYITESEEDFEQTLKFFTECKEKGLFRSSARWACIQTLTLGGTLSVEPNTEVYEILQREGISAISRRYWSYRGLDRFTRLERLFRAMVHIHELGFSHLLQGQIGGRYGFLWDEFQEYKNFNRVNREVIERLAPHFKNKIS